MSIGQEDADGENHLQAPNPSAPHPQDNNCGGDEEEEEEEGAVAGPRVLSHVNLAKTVCKYFITMLASLNIEINLTVQRQSAHLLAAELHQQGFINLIREFLYDQLYPNASSASSSDMPRMVPAFDEKILVYTSAVASFYAPSDHSGTGGMRRERIRATSSWRGGRPRYDCIFIHTDPSKEGMQGMDIARMKLFFSFNSCGTVYPCALIQWFSRIGNEPDEDTGMWIVQLDFHGDCAPYMAFIHLDSIVWAAHLIGVCGEHLPVGLTHDQSLDSFQSFYVNKFIDHHAFKTAF